MVKSETLVTFSENTSHMAASTDSRSVFLRVFGKISSSSMRTGIFSLLTLGIGCGCFTLPKVMHQVSLTIGILLIILGAWTCYLSLKLIYLASSQNNEKDFTKLTEKVLGPIVGYILSFAMILMVTIGILANQVISLFINSLQAHRKMLLRLNAHRIQQF